MGTIDHHAAGRRALPILAMAALLAARGALAEEPPQLPRVAGVERQPLVAQAERIVEALHYVGSPLPAADREKLDRAMAAASDAECVDQIQAVLDAHCIAGVHINPESRVKVARGPAPAELAQQGWRAFLVKVANEPGVTAALAVSSRHAQPVLDSKANAISAADVSDRWMDVDSYDEKPLNPKLSGLALEYRVVQIYSRDAGKREGELAFDVGQGSQDIGFRNNVNILFRCVPAAEVTLNVRDHDGQPVMAAFVIKDAQGRVYPYSAKRLEPDFFFHDQIYRADGETVSLPAGAYTIAYDRGPEYITKSAQLAVAADAPKAAAEFKLERWIDPNARGWFSGDHHIHASGCAHYKSPTIGVEPAAMMRHCLGEALNVGCVLTWGPGWYHQKRNFTGKQSPLSQGNYVMRYDVEVSGFPSDHCGHLVLLRLNEDDYPGTEEKADWPSWDLPILQWAKRQGGIVGVAHSGWGLDVAPERALPNYKIPPMDGIGAQEYIVDAAHDAIDFISTVDTPYVWELNIWYHVMNCGFPTKISGETDFPCIYGDKVGLGRSYVKLDPRKVDFEHWVQGMKAGRSYVSEGRTHLMDFTANGVAPGGPEASVLELAQPGKVKLRVDAAALLEEAPIKTAVRQTGKTGLPGGARSGRPLKFVAPNLPYFMNDELPYWHVERARVPGTRNVAVEAVVNGHPVARKEIPADGSIQAVEFDVDIERSSWVALRVIPAAHTNPVNVIVGGKPIRASKRSAQWCLDSIDKVWEQKGPRIRESERNEARQAFDYARGVYKRILRDAFDDRPTMDDLAGALKSEAGL